MEVSEMIRVTRTILMLRQKVLFNCGDSAKGRAEDCGEPAGAGARYPGGCQGLPQSPTPLIICCSGLGISLRLIPVSNISRRGR
jgi:hypothetical protein